MARNNASHVTPRRRPWSSNLRASTTVKPGGGIEDSRLVEPGMPITSLPRLPPHLHSRHTLRRGTTMQPTPKEIDRNGALSPGWIEVRDSHIHGRGIFAARLIPAGTEFMEYVGQRITKAVSLERCLAGNVYVFTLDDQWDLDGSIDENLARFANHSCTPNCESIMDEDDRIWIVSLRDIQPGEEITYNYGYDLEDYPDHPCCCGAPNCIGFIVAEELLPMVRQRLALATEAALPPPSPPPNPPARAPEGGPAGIEEFSSPPQRPLRQSSQPRSRHLA